MNSRKKLAKSAKRAPARKTARRRNGSAAKPYTAIDWKGSKHKCATKASAKHQAGARGRVAGG